MAADRRVGLQSRTSILGSKPRSISTVGFLALWLAMALGRSLLTHESGLQKYPKPKATTETTATVAYLGS